MFWLVLEADLSNCSLQNGGTDGRMTAFGRNWNHLLSSNRVVSLGLIKSFVIHFETVTTAGFPPYPNLYPSNFSFALHSIWRTLKLADYFVIFQLVLIKHIALVWLPNSEDFQTPRSSELYQAQSSKYILSRDFLAKWVDSMSARLICCLQW